MYLKLKQITRILVLSQVLLLLNCNFEVTILSYNVHCLFDDLLNGTEYKQYDPSKNSWNSELFHIKLERISEVIKRVYPGGPDIICLQEIENQNVLDKLISLYLEDMGYNYSVLIPVDEQATNIGVLSRYPVIHVHSHDPPKWKGIKLRNILELEIECNGNILYVFNNHWKSRLGGYKQTEKALIEAARIIQRRVHSILQNNPDADIVITGDLNENVEEYISIKGAYQTALIPEQEQVPEEYLKSSLFLTHDPDRAGVFGEKVVFYETWYELANQDWGSYVYQKKWHTLDHILLSDGLFDDKGFFYEIGNFEVIRQSYLVNPENGFPLTWKPFQKNRGYSDHLPLLLKLGVYE